MRRRRLLPYDRAMDIERLTRSQIVLLALLVSFVSAIASSIVTMRLLDRAPEEVVPKIINRVVERTIERVVTPVQPTQSSPQKERVVEKTVVVREEELVPTAVAEAQRVMVPVFRLFPSRGEGEVGTSTSGRPATPSATSSGNGAKAREHLRFVSHGLVVGDHLVLLPDRVVLKGASYRVAIGSQRFPARIALEGKGPFALLAISPKEKEGEGGVFPKPPTLLDPASLKLGQSIVVVGGVEAPRIALGFVSSLPPRIPNAVATTTPLADLFPPVDLSVAGEVAEEGALALSLFKEVIAMFDGTVYRILTPQGLDRMVQSVVEKEKAASSDLEQTE